MSVFGADNSAHHRVPSGNAMIAAFVEGAAGQPWIIFSNSLAADHSMWDGDVGAFAKSHRILRYDTRGHGASDAPAAPYSFDELAGDVLALMDHFEIDRATFVGLSLGGMTGLKLALDHPGRIARMICCDARASVPPVAHAAWDERAETARRSGMDAIVEGTLERWITEATRRDAPETVEAIRRMILRTSIEGYVGCIAAIKTANFLERLPALSVPTHYLVGDSDAGAPPNVMREMADRTRGAHLHIIPRAAHLPNMDDPSAFARALRDALADE